MPADFLFAIELSAGPASDRMLADLAAAVFANAGLARRTGDELDGALRKALVAGARRGHRRCRVRFQAALGTLTVSVACDGGAEWRTSRPLP